MSIKVKYLEPNSAHIIEDITWKRLSTRYELLLLLLLFICLRTSDANLGVKEILFYHDKIKFIDQVNDCTNSSEKVGVKHSFAVHIQ